MDSSPPGSSVHRILQARILEWVVISFSRGSSWPRDWIRVSHVAGRFFHLSHQLGYFKLIGTFCYSHHTGGSSTVQLETYTYLFSTRLLWIRSLNGKYKLVCQDSVGFLLLLLLSHWVVSDSFVTPWIVVHQAPLSMGFPRQEYWSGLSFPSPRDLPNPGIEPMSPALAGGFFTTEPPGSPFKWYRDTNKNKIEAFL